MAIYKVCLERPYTPSGQRPFNPFFKKVADGDKIHMHVREWEIEAESEEEIRKYYQEAIEVRMPTVYGYRIRSITLKEQTND